MKNISLILILFWFSVLSFVIYFFNSESKLDTAIRNFQNHEKKFYELFQCFNRILELNKNITIMFKINEKEKKIKVNYNDHLFANDLKNYHTLNLSLNDLNLENKFQKLKLTKKDIILIYQLLQELECEWIRNSEYFGNPIEIYYRATDWGSYSYQIYESKQNTPNKKVQNLIPTTVFRNKIVVLEHSSAL